MTYPLLLTCTTKKNRTTFRPLSLTEKCIKRILRHLILVCTVCLCPTKKTQDSSNCTNATALVCSLWKPQFLYYTMNFGVFMIFLLFSCLYFLISFFFHIFSKNFGVTWCTINNYWCDHVALSATPMLRNPKQK